jgi:multiple sugar transport system substrate-binding protein
MTRMGPIDRQHVAFMGRSRRIRIGAVGAAVAVMLVATACGGSSGGTSSNGKVTLSFAWWGDATRAKVTQAAINLFEQKHPNIKVTTEYAPFGSYSSKITTQVSGGNAPDLMSIDRGFQSEFAGRGVLADLSNQSSVLNVSGLEPNFAASGKASGKLVAVPFGQTTQTLVVDMTKLTSLGLKPPKSGGTWDDLKVWAQQVHDKSGGKVAGIADPGSTWAAFEAWQSQHGKALYTSSGKIAFTASDLKDFWNFTSDLRKSGAATPADVTATITGTPADEPLAKGLAAAEWDYDSVFGSYVKATTDQLALVPLPTFSGKTGMYAKPSMLLSVSSKSTHQKEAAQLLNFLVNDPAAANALGTGRGLFPNLSVRESLAKTAAGATKQVYDYEASQQSTFRQTPPAPPKGDGQLLTLMQRVYQAITFGQQSVSDGAASFMSQAQSVITP